MAPKSKRQLRIERQMAKKRQKTRNIVILSLLVLAAGAYMGFSRVSAPDVAQARLEDNPILGPVDAPVTITEFGDFTCSSCRSWHQAGVMVQILNQFDGLVRLEWRDLPIITADSPKAAQAGQCAHDQGRFWDYLDRVYNEPGSSYTNARPGALVRYAEEIGLDMVPFNSCLDGSQHLATVNFDLKFARSQGFNGTPSFMVNGTRVIGGTPELIVQAVEAALAEIQ